MEEKVHRLRCNGEEYGGCHEDKLRIDQRGDVVINGIERFEEEVAPIDTSSTSISKGGA